MHVFAPTTRSALAPSVSLRLEDGLRVGILGRTKNPAIGMLPVLLGGHLWDNAKKT